MRLLKRTLGGDLQLVSVNNAHHAPPYAILSHTWSEGQEVTFDELEAGAGKDKTGYMKILFCVNQAARDGIQYCWVDTCCIDKSAGQELQTAIISMFRWYSSAAKCYVYLSDVQVQKSVNDAQADSISWLEAFRRSKWFMRGWTLQELLAPASVEFFSQDGWNLGSRISLETEIYKITKIPPSALRGQSLCRFSIDDIASWALHRQTMLEEDRAYCLLGIFGVSMAIIYGEGQENALRRLGREIQQAAHSDRRPDKYRTQNEFAFTSLISPKDSFHTHVDQFQKNRNMRIRLLRYNQGGGLELVSFESETPPYAVLSHRWIADQEVTYRDLVAGTGTDKAGQEKIRFCGDRAAEDGLKYFWVDSCCIDKSTVYEESTAINSMFRWYQGACKCYVYLQDVHVSDDIVDAVAAKVTWQDAFRRSSWFTRGWTLQELLAPAIVEFFSVDGKWLGDKVLLEQEIHAITNIPIRALRVQDLEEFDFEERISWIANRITTRPEDRAYCLSGFFGVFVPTIYGEGEENALRRLQEEVQQTAQWNKRYKEHRIQNGSTFTSLIASPKALSHRHNISSQRLKYTNMRARLLRLAPNGSLELTDCSAGELPPYAVLSHTWFAHQDEVSYQDLVCGTGKDKPGYAKARFFGEKALQDGLNYFWIDTCCIDKSNRDELSTAINCMFRWYRGARRCYVYLSDVRISNDVVDVETPEVIMWRDAFRHSRWFTRGWTLQELLAPAFVEFFSADWKCLGSKTSLEQEIHEMTNIPIQALGGLNLEDFSFEERVSWGRNRMTLKEEDMVYCLLGLFGVYMPVIFGEGYEKAFRRLEEEFRKRQQSSAYTSGQAASTGYVSNGEGARSGASQHADERERSRIGVTGSRTEGGSGKGADAGNGIDQDNVWRGASSHALDYEEPGAYS